MRDRCATKCARLKRRPWRLADQLQYPLARQTFLTPRAPTLRKAPSLRPKPRAAVVPVPREAGSAGLGQRSVDVEPGFWLLAFGFWLLAVRPQAEGCPEKPSLHIWGGPQMGRQHCFLSVHEFVPCSPQSHGAVIWVTRWCYAMDSIACYTHDSGARLPLKGSPESYGVAFISGYPVLWFQREAKRKPFFAGVPDC